MKKKLFFLCSLLINVFIYTEKGIVIVPVSDLVGQPIQTFFPFQSVEESYSRMPWGYHKKDYRICPRIHQLIFHEIVDIIDEKKDEVAVRIPQLFYQTAHTKEPQSVYWTLKRNIIPFSTLIKSGIDIEKLPAPIEYINHSDEKHHNNIVTLIEPHTDIQRGISFSAGTRFKYTIFNNEDAIRVYYLDPTKITIACTDIPRYKLHIFQPKPIKARLKDFLAIVRKWAHLQKGVIPYLWGGCSFLDIHENNHFILKKNIVNGNELGYYARPFFKKKYKSGYDCSNLIARAAQIVGLPYFYKNTFTLLNNLSTITPYQKIEDGDLIWITGHVFIVANVKENTVIEAHAYDGGYGQVQEVPLFKVFKDIYSFKQLQDHCSAKKPLYRLKKDCSHLETYSELRFLRIAT